MSERLRVRRDARKMCGDFEGPSWFADVPRSTSGGLLGAPHLESARARRFVFRAQQRTPACPWRPKIGPLDEVHMLAELSRLSKPRITSRIAWPGL